MNWVKRYWCTDCKTFVCSYDDEEFCECVPEIPRDPSDDLCICKYDDNDPNCKWCY